MTTPLLQRLFALLLTTTAVAFSLGIAFLALQIVCRGMEQKLRSRT